MMRSVIMIINKRIYVCMSSTQTGPASIKGLHAQKLSHYYYQHHQHHQNIRGSRTRSSQVQRSLYM